MRVSIDRDEPGFCGHTLFHNRVRLDGVVQENVITADDERGEVVRFIVGQDGKPVRNPATREFLRETLHGRVIINAARK